MAAFNKAGHIPNARLLPAADFFNADKTFKAPDEIRRMLDYLGITSEQQIYTVCGGGVAASDRLHNTTVMCNPQLHRRRRASARGTSMPAPPLHVVRSARTR